MEKLGAHEESTGTFQPFNKKSTTFSVNMKLFNSKSKGGNTYPPPPAMSGFWQKNYQKPFIKVYLGGGGLIKNIIIPPGPWKIFMTLTLFRLMEKFDWSPPVLDQNKAARWFFLTWNIEILKENIFLKIKFWINSTLFCNFLICYQ